MVFIPNKISLTFSIHYNSKESFLSVVHVQALKTKKKQRSVGAASHALLTCQLLSLSLSLSRSTHLCSLSSLSPYLYLHLQFILNPNPRFIFFIHSTPGVSEMAFMAVLESDLRALSAEARRRYPAVKDGAEHAILKVRDRFHCFLFEFRSVNAFFIYSFGVLFWF